MKTQENYLKRLQDKAVSNFNENTPAKLKAIKYLPMFGLASMLANYKAEILEAGLLNESDYVFNYDWDRCIADMQHAQKEKCCQDWREVEAALTYDKEVY